jgi:putative transposase
MGVGVLGGVDQGEQDPTSEGMGGDSSGALPDVSVRAVRRVAVRRLLALRREGKLTTGQVRSAADVLGVRERAVWRWLAAAERDEAAARAPGERGGKTQDAELRRLRLRRDTPRST